MSEIAIYESDNGSISVKLEGETVWLSLQQMTDLFARDKSVISRHLRNVFAEGELERTAVVAKNATTAADGKTDQVGLFGWVRGVITQHLGHVFKEGWPRLCSLPRTMMRPLVKLNSSRTCRWMSHPACARAGVMNLVQMSLSDSDFLSIPMAPVLRQGQCTSGRGLALGDSGIQRGRGRRLAGRAPRVKGGGACSAGGNALRAAQKALIAQQKALHATKKALRTSEQALAATQDSLARAWRSAARRTKRAERGLEGLARGWESAESRSKSVGRRGCQIFCV